MTARLVALALVLAASTAAADRGAAERYFRAGEKAYHAQDFESAAQNFELAYKELPLPEIAFSAAQAYRRQYRVDPRPGYVQRAVELYRAYLSKVKTGGRVADASDGLAEMQHELDKLGGAGAVRAETTNQTLLGVTVSFTDVREAPLGAVREVDDRATATAPAVAATIDGQPVPLDKLLPYGPGDHVVRAVAPGYRAAEKRVHAIGGAQDIVELELAPLPARLTVRTERGATISIDGVRRGPAPLGAFELPGGPHVLSVTARGREVGGRSLVLHRAETLAVDVPLEKTLRRRAVPWVAGTAGALGLVCIAATGGAIHWNGEARSLRDRIRAGDAEQDVLASYSDARDRRDVARIGAFVTGGLAVGVGLAAAWLYYFDRPAAEGVRVTPVAGPDGAGAMLFGRF